MEIPTVAAPADKNGESCAEYSFGTFWYVLDVLVPRFLLGGIAAVPLLVFVPWQIPGGVSRESAVPYAVALAGGVIALLLPRPWGKIRIYRDRIVLSGGRRAVEIPTGDVRLIAAPMEFSFSLGDEQCESIFLAARAIRIRTDRSTCNVRLSHALLTEAFNALVARCPYAVGVMPYFRLRVGEQGFARGPGSRADEVDSAFARETRNPAVKAALLLALVGTGILFVLGSFPGPNSVLALPSLGVIVLVYGGAGVFYLTRAVRIHRARRAFRREIEEQGLDGQA